MITVIKNAFSSRGYPVPKIYFDSPVDSNSDPYWLGDDIVDITGMDLYFNPAFNGATSLAAWNLYLTTQLGHVTNFAATHNKPLAFPEWCDMYTDTNPPYAMTQLINWMITNHAVFQTYWDSDDAGTTCSMFHYTPRVTLYNQYFGNTVYSSAFFSPLKIPSPANNRY